MREVQRIEADPVDVAEDLVNLRIDQDPALLLRVPVLTDDVIRVEVRFKVGCEAIPHAGRNLLQAQESTQQRRMITAIAQQAFLR